MGKDRTANKKRKEKIFLSHGTRPMCPSHRKQRPRLKPKFESLCKLQVFFFKGCKLATIMFWGVFYWKLVFFVLSILFYVLLDCIKA